MDYNKAIEQLIKTCFQQIDLDFNLIKRIYITVYDSLYEWLGKVETINIDGNLYFELLLHHEVVNELISQDADKISRAYSIIMHELYHCKEMHLTSQYINWQELFFQKTFSTTKSLIIHTAIQQWSEYYAYYNSAKIKERKIELLDNLSPVEAVLITSHDRLIRINDTQLIDSFITRLTDFIRLSIMFVAYYNSTHSLQYLKELEKIQRCNLYSKYYSYFFDLASYMDILYNTYPNWVSEDKFIELGHKLFSFMKINHLYFSSDDLSDGFEIKIV